VWDAPPHIDTCGTSTSRIEEVLESHIIQVKEAATPADDEDEDGFFSHDIFEVFTTKKKKHGDKASKAPELSAPAPSTPAPTAAAIDNSRPDAQYRYRSNAEDHQLVSELEEYLMQGKLALTTPAHIFAASPIIRKNITKKLKLRHMETHEYKVAPGADPQLQPMQRATMHDSDSDPTPHLLTIIQPPTFCLPLQEVDVVINNSIHVPAILDTGSQITVIRQDIVQSLGAKINYQRLIEMEGANGATNWTIGCAKNLTLQVGDAAFKVHAHVVETISFGLLLGHPFQQTALCCFEDLPTGEVEVSVHDPTNIARRIFLITHPCTARAPPIKTFTIFDCNPPPLTTDQTVAPHTFPPHLMIPATSLFESTQEGRILNPLGDVMVGYVLASERANSDHVMSA